MIRSLILGMSVPLLLVGNAGRLWAADAPAEVMPAPRVAVNPNAPIPMTLAAPPIPLRPNRYEVWQNLAVDNRGYFQPLVIQSPDGFVYRYNGAPAPWVTVNPRSFQRVYIGQ